jgi:hypothetical protein
MIKFNNDKLFFAILIIWSLFLAKVIPVEIREIGTY